MFTKLTTKTLPEVNRKVLMVGKTHQQHHIFQVMTFNGIHQYQGIPYYQFIQDDYGVWDMSGEQLEKSRLNWVYTTDVIDIANQQISIPAWYETISGLIHKNFNTYSRQQFNRAQYYRNRMLEIGFQASEQEVENLIQQLKLEIFLKNEQTRKYLEAFKDDSAMLALEATQALNKEGFYGTQSI